MKSWWKRKRKDKTKSSSGNAIHYSAIIMVSEAELNQYGNSSIAFPNYFGLAYVMPLLMASFTGAISRAARQGSSRPNPLSRDVHYSTALCCNVNHAFVNWSAVAAGIAVGEWFLEHLNRTTGIINETRASRSGQRSTHTHSCTHRCSTSAARIAVKQPVIWNII